MTAICPLCDGTDILLFFRQQKPVQRDHLRCRRCELVFVPPAFHLSAESEKAVYDQHCNHPDDPAYRQFLSRLFLPMLEKLPAAASGLDFGCGPGPALSLMFRQAGFDCVDYDIFYQRDDRLLQQSYDFISCSEVAEHLSRPGQVLSQLVQLLKPGGWLGIMSKRVDGNPEHFARWHYIHDPTHISFFSENSFRWLARHYPVSLTIPAADVVLLQKNA